MGLGDHLGFWINRLGGNEGRAKEAQRRILVDRAEGLDRAGRSSEAVDLYLEAGESPRAAVVAQRAKLWKKAGDILASIDRFADAARSYEQAQDWASAGTFHER